MGAQPVDQKHGSRLAVAAAVSLVWALGCGASDSESSGGGAAAPSEPMPGYELISGLQVPAREIQDETLPDSCDLLTEARPLEMIDEPFAPVERMSNVCIAYAASTPTFDRSLSVELRRPEPLEQERDDAGVPRNEEEFWVAEGAGVGLVGGKQEELEEIGGLGDYTVWYPIRGGMALHTYWNREYILAINVRGVPIEKGVAWAQEVARAAIRKTASEAEGDADDTASDTEDGASDG